MPLYCRYKDPDVECLLILEEPTNPKPQNPSFSTKATSTKQRQILTVGHSSPQGSDCLICQEDPFLNVVSWRPRAWVKDITRRLPRLVWPTDHSLLLFFHVGGDKAVIHSSKAIDGDFRALRFLLKDLRA